MSTRANGRWMRSQDVILTLSRLMKLYGKPQFIRSDNVLRTEASDISSDKHPACDVGDITRVNKSAPLIGAQRSSGGRETPLTIMNTRSVVVDGLHRT